MKEQETITKPTAPGWAERRIASWAELQEAIDPLAAQCLFRGQGSQAWPLISSFNRLVPCMDETMALQWELIAILNFRSQAHLHLPPTVMPPNPFKLDALDTYIEWLMIMQHYGAPTRLLDWSQSPYVAIYFAVIECSAQDAALWYFESAAVFKKIAERYGKKPDEFIDYADFQADEIRRPEAEPLLYTAMKKFRTAREIAQQGLFSLSNRLSADQQDVIAQGCAGHKFGRMIIPHELKAEFCYRLGLMNVTAAALFPGVEGVCSAIRDALRLAVANLPTGTDPAAPPESLPVKSPA
jgi:hypothetical protein